MYFTVTISPAPEGGGYDLRCNDRPDRTFHHARLLHALMAAAQIGGGQAGCIQVFDAAGRLVDEISLQSKRLINRALRACQL